jgi:hypothetical protein
MFTLIRGLFLCNSPLGGRQAYRSLLQKLMGHDGENNEEEEGDMEISFTPGLTGEVRDMVERTRKADEEGHGEKGAWDLYVFCGFVVSLCLGSVCVCVCVCVLFWFVFACEFVSLCLFCFLLLSLLWRQET